MKKKLTLDEQINHLESKNIRFSKMSQEDAKTYLENNNNYFKLRSYRTNFLKYQYGENKGKYENLEFAYLVDLAIVDTRLRMIILEMALNIEHFSKVKLLSIISKLEDEDGYTIVREYINQLTEKNKNRLEEEFCRNKRSVYCNALINKYELRLPVWVFVEIISFGSFLSFYRFCAEKLLSNDLLDDYYLMMTVKDIRNAAAHNNCILNDLISSNSKHDPNYIMMKYINKNNNISKQTRRNKFKNERIRQLCTLIYSHQKIVSSTGVKKHINENLNSFFDRVYRDFDYKFSNTLRTSFDFLINIVDIFSKQV